MAVRVGRELVRRRIIASLTVLAALLLVPQAHADTMTWDFAALVAHDYWQQQGHELPCDPTPYLLTDAEDADLRASYPFDVDMAADLQGCRVLITPYAEWFRTHDGAWNYCQAIVHEFGHLASLDHDHGGVMDAMPYVAPFGCSFPRQWAARQGWRQPPRWVRRSPAGVERLWLRGRVWRAQIARARWLESR